MRLSVLDIGSNTVHLLLVDAHAGGQPAPYASFKQPLSLVQYLDDAGRITDEGQDRLIEFINEAHQVALENDAEDLIAFATSAMREAPNGEEVLSAVAERAPVTLLELPGDREAAVTFFATRRWFGWGAGTILNLDIGGGSFEMAMGADELPTTSISSPLGAGRLTRDWLDGDPPTARSIKKLRSYIKETLAEPAEEIRALGRPDLVAGTSKTFRSLARIAGAAPSSAGPYVRRVLLREDVARWAQRMSAMDSADRANLPGVSETRAPQMLAGALVAEAAMLAFDVESIQICPWALREGLILRRLDQLVVTGAAPSEWRDESNRRMPDDVQKPVDSKGRIKLAPKNQRAGAGGDKSKRGSK